MRYQIYLLKQDELEVERDLGFKADSLAAIIPAGYDLVIT